MTTQPPTVPGYYWWTNLGEHTPCILEVKEHRGELWAENYEFGFRVDPEPHLVTEPDDLIDEPTLTIDGIDYYYDSYFWAGPIDLPELNGEKIQPDSF